MSKYENYESSSEEDEYGYGNGNEYGKDDENLFKEYSKYLLEINNPLSLLINNEEWKQNEEKLNKPIEECEEFYDFILDFIEIFNKMFKDFKYSFFEVKKYFLGGNFINKTLYCYDFYKILKDIELFVISNIDLTNLEQKTILDKYVLNMKQKEHINILYNGLGATIYYKTIKLITFFMKKI